MAAAADGFAWLDAQPEVRTLPSPAINHQLTSDRCRLRSNQAHLLQWVRTPPDDLKSAPSLREHAQQIAASVGDFQAAVARRLCGGGESGPKRRRVDRAGCSVLDPQPAGSRRFARLSSGCDVLDAVLRGGFPCGSLSEVVGEASCGKTQICLQLLLAAQLPARLGGLEGSAIYISTEGQLPKQRLQQIAMERPSFREHFQVEDPCAHLFLKQAHNPDELGFLIRQLPQLVEQQLSAAPDGSSPRPVRLVVIDSLAAPYRGAEREVALDSNRRTLELLAHGARLKQLAARGGRDHGLAVVITNQVTAVMTDDSLQGFMPAPLSSSSSGALFAPHAPRPGMGGWPSSAHCWPYGTMGKGAGTGAVPSLGLAWSSTPNTRVLLTKARRPFGFIAAPGTGDEKGSGTTSRRFLQVLNSPTAARHGCEYALTASGVTGIADFELGAFEDTAELQT